MGCQQCLPPSVVQLKGKHCRKPHCRNGVVDTFQQYLLRSFSDLKRQTELHYVGWAKNKLNWFWCHYPLITYLSFFKISKAIRHWSCSKNQNKKWPKNVKSMYCKIESKSFWRHMWNLITKSFWSRIWYQVFRVATICGKTLHIIYYALIVITNPICDETFWNAYVILLRKLRMSSQILQNSWINIVLNWKFWRKYRSVSYWFSCTVHSISTIFVL